MEAALNRLVLGLTSLGGVLGLIFAVTAANDSAWSGAGLCILGGAAALATAGHFSRSPRT